MGLIEGCLPFVRPALVMADSVLSEWHPDQVVGTGDTASAATSALSAFRLSVSPVCSIAALIFVAWWLQGSIAVCALVASP